MEISLDEPKVDTIPDEGNQADVEHLFGIKEKAIPTESPQLEAIEYFIRDAHEATKSAFWEAFDSESNRLPEKKSNRLRRLIEEHKLDESKFNIYSGEEAIKKLKDFNLEIFVEDDLAREGVLIYELPDALSKRWWRKTSEGDSGILMPWGNVYESVISALRRRADEVEDKEGVWLQQINPIHYHSHGKYYYVWYVRDLDEKNDHYFDDDPDTDDIEEVYAPLHKNALSKYTGLKEDELYPDNSKYIFIGRKDGVTTQLGESATVTDLNSFCDMSADSKADRIFLPYFITKNILEFSKDDWQRFFVKANELMASPESEIIVFPLPDRYEGEMSQRFSNIFINLAPLLWQNGGDLDFEVLNDGSVDTLRVFKKKKPDQEVKKTESDRLMDEAVIYVLNHSDYGDELEDVNLRDGYCYQGCRTALEYLSVNHGDKFQKLLLLNSYGYNYDIESWGYHYFLLTQGINGRWYATSPANISRGEINAPIFSSESLDEILDSIKQSGGGEWPTSSQIENTLYIPPVMKKIYGRNDDFRTAKMITEIYKISPDCSEDSEKTDYIVRERQS